MDYQSEAFRLDKITFSGLLMIVVGLVLALAHSVASGLFKFELHEWVGTGLSHLGAGLIAAGILSIVLDRAERQRHQREMAELRDAHSEAILKELMPDPIFKEVQAHIIRQPFLRSNFQASIELTRMDHSRDYLRKIQTCRYDVQNVSRTLERYELRASEERMHDSKFPGSTAILSIATRSGNLLANYEGGSLEPYLQLTPEYVRAIIPLSVRPQETVSVIATVASVMYHRDVYSLLANKPTLGMDCIVAHPKDIVVRGVPLHPSQSAFETEVDTPSFKRWKIHAALLPFQGIELSWQPLDSTVIGG